MKLKSKDMSTSKDKIIEALKTVEDPELKIDIYTLGLIYDIEIQDDTTVRIAHTYTTPMCPFGPVMQQKMREVMIDLGFKNIELELEFDPPWEPNEDLRVMLGI